MITTDNSTIITTKSNKVSILTNITVAGSGTSLPIKHVADFSKIPENMKNVYLKAFMNQHGL